MAALSAARMTKSRSLGRKVSYLMKASTQIYAGGMVMINSAGTAEPAAAHANNHGVVGVATESVLSTSAGERIVVQEGIFLMDGDSLAQTACGDVVFADDDATVDETQASNCPKAGKMVEYVSSTSAWVDIGLAQTAAI